MGSFKIGEFVWDKNRTICELISINDNVKENSFKYFILDSNGTILTNNIQKLKPTNHTFRDCVLLVSSHLDSEPIFSINHPTLTNDEVHYIKGGIRIIFVKDGDVEYYSFSKTILDTTTLEIKSQKFPFSSIGISENFDIFAEQLIKHIKNNG